jgi:hypothetical protein
MRFQRENLKALAANVRLADAVSQLNGTDAFGLSLNT